MRRLLALFCSLAIAAVGLSACGEDGEDTTTGSEEASSGAPQAAASLDDAVAQLNDVIASGDCDGFVELTFSALRANASGSGPAEAGESVRPQECRDNGADALLAELEGTTFEESEDYGSAAISQGPTTNAVEGYDMWAAIWVVDRDGQWRTISYYPTDPQFEEDLPEEADPVGVTQQMVDAIESGDCSDAEQFMGEQIRFGATPEEACESLAGGSIFAPAVRAADEVTVEEIGVARDYAIVGIDTGDTYFAAQLATPPIDPGEPVQDEVQVVDVVPQTEFELVEPKGGK